LYCGLLRRHIRQAIADLARNQNGQPEQHSDF